MAAHHLLVRRYVERTYVKPHVLGFVFIDVCASKWHVCACERGVLCDCYLSAMLRGQCSATPVCDHSHDGVTLIGSFPMGMSTKKEKAIMNSPHMKTTLSSNLEGERGREGRGEREGERGREWEGGSGREGEGGREGGREGERGGREQSKAVWVVHKQMHNTD